MIKSVCEGSEVKRKGKMHLHLETFAPTELSHALMLTCGVKNASNVLRGNSSTSGIV